ncbi:MAG: SoxR reducing system RseC family protein [Deferribacteres bacterium]|nr:SoxR reducing system RseC family protein [Deferribacteres bacterium]
MEEEIGVVKSIDGMTARVLVSRKASCCESCEKDVCDVPEEGVETEAINAVGASVGQKVKIVMKSYSYFKGAMLIYVLPVFALIIGAVLGKVYLPAYFPKTDSDLLAAAGGFLLFFISLLPLKILSSGMNKKTEYKPVIESIIAEGKNG